MLRAASACIYAGGAHHTCFSQAVHTQFMQDFAEMAGIELVEIGKETDLKEFKKELQWDEVYHRICTA